jgi:dolichol-phosphate mannosyltransferase
MPEATATTHCDSNELTLLKLSIVIPARNEEGCISETVNRLAETLRHHGIPNEIIVVDDGSTDRTSELISNFAAECPNVRLTTNIGRHGFGMAVRVGLERATGDAVAVVMADGSDSPDDVVTYYRKIEEGYECAFGSRFLKGSRIIDYPKHKLILNRLVNNFIRAIFQFKYNDTTNAFKMYRKYVIDAMQPLISPHFNLTVEMPLKAVVRGFSYAVVPISWTNRAAGESKLKLQEMGSRYLFIVLYLWLEKVLSRGDYHRQATLPETICPERRVIPHA